MPTQRYCAPSRKVGKIFVATLSVDIGSVRYRKWNSERVIIFQSVILQHSKYFNNAKHICTLIQFWLNWWNRGVIYELVKDTFDASIGVLGEISQDPKQGAMPSYVLEPGPKSKIVWGSQICLCTGNGGVCNPTNWQRIEQATLMKQSRRSWWENIRKKTFPPVAHYRHTIKCLFLFP